MKHSVNIDELVTAYVGGKTTRQLAIEFSIPARTICRYLNKAGCSLRNPGAEINPVHIDRAALDAMYWGDGMSTTQIAERIGSTPSRVSYWLRQHGIETRSVGSELGHDRFDDEGRKKLSEAKRGRFLGSENPNWRGGTPFRDPERNRYPAKVWSRDVRERDGCCQECGATERLHAHHIKRWKDYPELRYELSNGVTLCHACHERAHGRGFKFRWRQ